MQVINYDSATDTLAYSSVIKSVTVNICPVLLLVAEKRYIRCNTSTITIADRCAIRPTCRTTGHDITAKCGGTSEIVRIRCKATVICGRNCKCRKCKGREYKLGDEHSNLNWLSMVVVDEKNVMWEGHTYIYCRY